MQGVTLWLVLLVFVFCLLAACATMPTPANPPLDQMVNYTNNIFWQRYVDREAGVVCWVYASKAISCLPVTQTKLDK